MKNQNHSKNSDNTTDNTIETVNETVNKTIETIRKSGLRKTELVTRKLIAYISGPYRSPNIEGVINNIDEAREVALKYWGLGYTVICPHMNTALFDGMLDDSIWLEGDIEILKRCDVVVMMAGWEKSEGATIEHRVAWNTGKKIIYDRG